MPPPVMLQCAPRTYKYSTTSVYTCAYILSFQVCVSVCISLLTSMFYAADELHSLCVCVCMCTWTIWHAARCTTSFASVLRAARHMMMRLFRAASAVFRHISIAITLHTYTRQGLGRCICVCAARERFGASSQVYTHTHICDVYALILCQDSRDDRVALR